MYVCRQCSTRNYCTPFAEYTCTFWNEYLCHSLQSIFTLVSVSIHVGSQSCMSLPLNSREFFHLLCLEFINPQYALFQSVNGLIRPSPCSSVNPNHLIYFQFFGKVLARMICDSMYMYVDVDVDTCSVARAYVHVLATKDSTLL